MVSNSNLTKYFINRIVETEKAKQLIKRYELLMDQLEIITKTIFRCWVKVVPELIETNIVKTLIERGADKLLKLNFDPDLVGILKEVYYLKLMDKDKIPEAGQQFADKADTYYNYTVHLDKSIKYYNQVNSLYH